jgi:uncharacterized repeat protein (TIGR02543 family)
MSEGSVSARFVVVTAIVLAMLGASMGIVEHGVGAAPRAKSHPKGTFVHQPLNPVAGNEAFAKLRGKGYEQALVGAHKEATALPKAVVSPSSSSTAWASLGPDPISNSYYGTINSGRVTGIAVAPSSPQTLYLAAAGGGVWSSTNNGSTWTTKTDQQPDLAMGSVAVDPNKSSVIFAGTGEDNECLDCFYGDGILESTNSGSTWSLSNPAGVFSGVDVSSLVFEPGATSLATTEVLAGTSNGLYVSTNGGSTWSAEAGTGWSNGNVYNVVLNTLTPSITIYASVMSVGIEKSTNNGSSWTTLSSSPLVSGSSFENAAIGIYPGTTAATTTLYASLGSFSGYLGMFKSTNGGGTWSSLTVPYYTGDSYSYDSTTGDAGDQSWYDNTLIVSPTDANIVVAGGIALIESTDGGSTWTNLDGQAFFGGKTNLIHPDFHSLAFDGSGNLYIGCDGGAWELNAAGVASPGSVSATNYTNLNANLDITQFYPGTAQSGNASTILAGAQDNGTSLFSSSNSPPTTWPNVLSGDGGEDIVDPANTSIQFAEADQVAYGTTNGWASATDLFAPKALGGPPALVAGLSDWVPPLVLVSTTGPTIYYGGNVVYESTNGGSTWSSVATSYSSSDVSALAVAPSNNSVIYAGFNDGTLQMSTDGGTTWTTLVSSGSNPIDGMYITHIAVNSTNPDTVYISLAETFPQHHASGQGPHVLVGASLDTTPSWTDVTGDLPADVPTNSVVSDGATGLIVASDAGVFTASVLNGSSTSWSEVGTNLPNSQVMDILLNSSGTLIATTHGRGVWTIPFSPTGKNTYSVTYQGNGSTGGTVPIDPSSPYDSGATVTVLANTGDLVDTGHSFTGWNTAANGSGTPYAASGSATFVMPAADVVLYAQWSASASFTVTFNGNGGTGSMANETNNAPTALTLNSFTRSGKSFKGWNTAKKGTGTSYANGAIYPFTASVTLYAQWVNLATQTITFGKLANKTLAQSPVIVSATASSGLAVTFTTTTSTVCTSSGTDGATIKLLKPGKCTVEANQSGGTAYKAAKAVKQSFTVST